MGCLCSCLRGSTHPRETGPRRYQRRNRDQTPSPVRSHIDFNYSYRHRGSSSTPFPFAKNPAPELLLPKSDDSTFPYWSDESKSSEGIACAICFDGYNFENPMITLECSHHYHLSCIYEWMNRTDTCPTCRQVIIFDNPELNDIRN